tara:strand:+ start:2582 stop:2782 length:201 start_codon:yes stop_codon:yes gene_type:complete
MTVKSDPLEVLLEVKGDMQSELSDELVKACYLLQSEHQYDKDRTTLKKMQALIEEVIVSDEEGVLL